MNVEVFCSILSAGTHLFTRPRPSCAPPPSGGWSRRPAGWNGTHRDNEKALFVEFRRVLFGQAKYQFHQTVEFQQFIDIQGGQTQVMTACSKSIQIFSWARKLQLQTGKFTFGPPCKKNITKDKC